MGRISKTGSPFLVGLLTLAVFLPGAAAAQTSNAPGDEAPSFEAPAEAEAVPGQLIVKFEEDATTAEEADARRDEGLVREDELELIDAEVAKVEGQSVEQAVRDLERRPDVEYAEPDHILSRSGYADELRFGELWGLNNTGQTIQGSAGSPDFDVNAPEASRVTQGSSDLVVAVVDTGVDFSHPDLADRAWKNPGESGAGKENNGQDDDGNGYVDDVNGWDFYHDDRSVYDAADGDSHGTHVSGTIAASVNGQGIVGVAPNVKIMALKFLGSRGGSTSDAIEAIGYAKGKGVKISNNSWGGMRYNQALKDAIFASGMLFVAAAGNGGADGVGDNNNAVPSYPASYDSPNILSVAAVDNKGGLASFSNYGATSVDISAPGVSILSAVPGDSYDYYNGTSMATPHATGVAALAASANSSLLGNPAGLKKTVMDNAKAAPSTSGKTVTGKMVDANAAVIAAGTDTVPPTVAGVAPADGAKNVAANANVTVTFSEAMSEASVEAAGVFTLTKEGEGAALEAAVTYDVAGKKAILNPTADLEPGATYTARIEAGAKDAAGNPLAADKVWSFTTGAPGGEEPPDDEEPVGPGRGCTIRGTDGDNVLEGTPESDVICGGKGNDTIDGAAGDDVIRGGRGVDVVSGGEGDDLLRGKRGGDDLDGGEGTDTVRGGRGDDECVVDPGDKETKSCRGVGS